MSDSQLKPFHRVAIPHSEIGPGQMNMDHFVADLWLVSQDRGPDIYRDPVLFFSRTHITEGLRSIINSVHDRLMGRGGDAIIQIQTPFGGGKTHAMITLYHKAREWNIKTVVIVGTALDSQQTLWGTIERHLTGRMIRMSGLTAPGKDTLRAVIGGNEPVLILIDELLEYMTKAAGVPVGGSDLAAQTLAFMQELTELAVATSGLCVVITVPPSTTEHYDRQADLLFRRLQKISGRVEKIYTPVCDDEILSLIRRRLFSQVDEDAARTIVTEFTKYAEHEGILPTGVQASEYRNRFLKSYPFMPELVDLLYRRWGSLPTFQRARGILRVLSLIMNALWTSDRPYIGPADTDLSRQDIRQELLKHIGPQYDGIIEADITGNDSNARRVDREMGSSYVGLGLAVRTATTILLHSFSSGRELGIVSQDIKRCVSFMDHPSAVVSETLKKLKKGLFYLQHSGDTYFFSNQPSINRIILTYKENITDQELRNVEIDLLKRSIGGNQLRTFLWEEDPASIPDTADLKLVVLSKRDEMVMDSILKSRGQTPRVYRNTIFFLYPSEDERPALMDNLKHMMACRRLLEDSTQSLSDEQRNSVREELDRTQRDQTDALLRLYRCLSIPVGRGTKEIDLGIPVPGERTGIAQRAYERLVEEDHVLVSMSPLVLLKKYLESNEFVNTRQVYESCLRTPGEARPISKSVIEQAVEEGVSRGIFGLGTIENGNPVCLYFGTRATVSLSESEIIMREELCRHQREHTVANRDLEQLPASDRRETHGSVFAEENVQRGQGRAFERIRLRFALPSGKLSDLLGMVRYLQSRFETTQVDLLFEKGSISEDDYQNKVLEALEQMGVDFEVEKD
ncbi:MAG: DUF499 domain-containing protein [Candidatus Thorarchaeota archaeon]